MNTNSSQKTEKINYASPSKKQGRRYYPPDPCDWHAQQNPSRECSSKDGTESRDVGVFRNTKLRKKKKKKARSSSKAYLNNLSMHTVLMVAIQHRVTDGVVTLRHKALNFHSKVPDVVRWTQLSAQFLVHLRVNISELSRIPLYVYLPTCAIASYK